MSRGQASDNRFGTLQLKSIGRKMKSNEAGNRAVLVAQGPSIQCVGLSTGPYRNYSIDGELVRDAGGEA